MRKKTEGGFIALTSVLIIGAIILILGVSIFYASLTDQTISTAYQNSQEADFLADFCLREGVLRLEEDINYRGGEEIRVGDKTCYIDLVDDIPPNTKKVSSLGKAGEQPHFSRASQLVLYAIEPATGDWSEAGGTLEKVRASGDSLTLILSQEEEVSSTIDSYEQWNDYFSKTDDIDITVDGSLILATAEPGAEEVEGYRISNPINLSAITDAASSSIEWTAETPLGTNVIIQTAVTNSDSEEPDSWDDATSGEPIPGIVEGDNLYGKFLWTKQILQASESAVEMPRLDSLLVTVTMSGETEGYRISPALDISGGGVVKDSRIFWQAEEEFNGIISKVEVAVSYNEGSSWTKWEDGEVINGSSIPGLESGRDLFGARIKTKTSFVGGSGYYPNLKNLKIFIEAEEK